MISNRGKICCGILSCSCVDSDIPIVNRTATSFLIIIIIWFNHRYRKQCVQSKVLFEFELLFISFYGGDLKQRIYKHVWDITCGVINTL